MRPEAGKAYACRNLDREGQRRSSSGGIYPLLADAVLESGGVVYAVRYHDDYHVGHCRVTAKEELAATVGSKYAASVPDVVLREAAEDLKSGRRVFFVGTPCQCAGFLSFLQENRISRENLLCMDFVCHGTPSGRIWQTYLSRAVADREKITGVNMRDKTNGWIEYSLRIDAGEETVLSSRRENPYILAFVGNLDLRPSCYECPFKGVGRPTDLTVGDYWGVKRFAPGSYDPDGVSLMLVHTDTGAQRIAGIADRIHMEEAVLGEAVKSNPCIVRAVKRPDKRERFLQMLRDGVPFETAAERALHRSVLEKAEGRLLKALGRKKTPGSGAGAGAFVPLPEETAPPVLFARKEECCGCTACRQICPAGAIDLAEDEEGFVYPRINADKCVGCRRCVKVCPMHRPADWSQF